MTWEVYYHFTLPSATLIRHFKKLLRQNFWNLLSQVDHLDTCLITLCAAPELPSSAPDAIQKFLEVVTATFPDITYQVQPPIDWQLQWALHHELTQEGDLVLDSQMLQNYLPHTDDRLVAHSLILRPGPGFGDLSHSTTLLTLRLLSNHLATLTGSSSVPIVDIGSGSGILSCFCSLFPHTLVHGVDIQSEAIEHARINASLNQFQALSFSTWQDLPTLWQQTTPSLALLNMLPHEQTLALASLPVHWKKIPFWIVSGVPNEEFHTYCKRMEEQYGWTLSSSISEQNWSAAIFCVSDFF